MSLTFDRVNEIMRESKRADISPEIPTSLTKEQAFYWRIKNDFPWYAENFLKIRNKNSKLVPFRLNDAQIMFEGLDKYCRDNKIMRRYIVLKARQMGMSTYTEGKIFHETANDKYVRSLIVAHEEKASVNLFNMSKLYYEELPDVIRPVKKYNNGKILSFENPSNDESEKRKNPGLRSNITIATAGSGDIGRSSTPTKLHISELAFFPDARTSMLGLLQGVPVTLETFVIYESTANGIGDYFHEQWRMAVSGESDFIPVFLPWFTDSTYTSEFSSDAELKAFADEVNYTHKDGNGNVVYTYEHNLMEKHNLTYGQLKWRRWAIRNKCGGDEEHFQQEYPSTPEEAFLATGRPKFNIRSLKQYQTQTKPPLTRGYLFEENGNVKFVEDDKGYISVWQRPELGVYYAIGADVAEGTIDGDYSCGIVGDPENMDVVAMWHGHIDPDLFGKELVKLARWYNNAYLGVEANNHGLTTLNAIKKEEYWNIYFQKQFDKISQSQSQKIGWTTSSRTKPLMIDKLAQFVREKWIGIPSDLILSEMFTYIIEDNGSTNAQVGCHDDTTMAFAIWLQLALEGLGEDFTPEIPRDQGGRAYRRNDMLDPLFDSEEDDDEFAE